VVDLEHIVIATFPAQLADTIAYQHVISNCLWHRVELEHSTPCSLPSLRKEVSNPRIACSNDAYKPLEIHVINGEANYVSVNHNDAVAPKNPKRHGPDPLLIERNLRFVSSCERPG